MNSHCNHVCFIIHVKYRKISIITPGLIQLCNGFSVVLQLAKLISGGTNNLSSFAFAEI